MAWPTVIHMSILTAYNLINRAFLGHTKGDSSVALAAIGIGGVVLWIQQALMFGISTGGSALASRALGAKERENACEATRQSLILSVLVAVMSGLPMILLATQIARFAGAKGAVIQPTADYVLIMALFSIPMFLQVTMSVALRSAGDTKSSLYSGVVIVAANILLDWLLIFGVGPFPRMGVQGAAIATGVARILGMLVVLIRLRGSILKDALSHFIPHWEWFGRIMKIGVPAIAQNLMWSVAFLFFVKVLSMLPDAKNAQAALTVAMAIEMVAFMPGNAYGIAAAPLVGQNLGAKKPKRAEKCAWSATWQAIAIMTFVGTLFVAVPGIFAKAFTNKETVARHIISYLRINGLMEPFLAVAMVLTGALQGAGDTMMPMAIEFVTSGVVRLPLAWYLGVKLGYGTTGAWIAMAFSTFLYGVMIAAWFKYGNWRTRKV